MKNLSVLIYVLVVLFLSSCRNEKVDEAVHVFLNTRTINSESFSYSKTLDELACHYIGIYSLQDVEEQGDSLFKVKVKLEGEGRDISILVKQDSVDSYKVVDCWGVVNFIEEYTLELWEYAKKIGCLSNLETLSDLEVYDRMSITGAIFYSNYKKISNELNSKIEVTKQNWQRGYNNYASGSAIIYNGSSYTLPNLKYKIEYSDIHGDVITEDKGVVSYEPFHPGEYKSFSFYTAYVGNAKYAWIRPVIDENFVIKLLNKASCTGNEFVDYVKEYDVKLVECAWEK